MADHSNKPGIRKASRAEAGKAGGLAPHRCRGRGCSKSSSILSWFSSGSEGSKESHAKSAEGHKENSHLQHQKAGRAGGLAPHTCRGRQCH